MIYTREKKKVRYKSCLMLGREKTSTCYGIFVFIIAAAGRGQTSRCNTIRCVYDFTDLASLAGTLNKNVSVYILLTLLSTCEISSWNS